VRRAVRSPLLRGNLRVEWALGIVLTLSRTLRQQLGYCKVRTMLEIEHDVAGIRCLMPRAAQRERILQTYTTTRDGIVLPNDYLISYVPKQLA